MDLDELKQDLMKDPRFKEQFEHGDLALDISKMITEARIIRGITQEKLAKLVETGQSSIARIESGTSLPSLTFLEKIAIALKARLIVVLDLFVNTNKDVGIEISTKTKPSFSQKSFKYVPRLPNNNPSYIASSKTIRPNLLTYGVER